MFEEQIDRLSRICFVIIILVAVFSSGAIVGFAFAKLSANNAQAESAENKKVDSAPSAVR